MTKFQFIILGIFTVFIVGGVIAFATFKGSGNVNSTAQITIWGTFPSETFDSYVSKVNTLAPEQVHIVYVQKNASDFSREFVAALARGTGPDAILISADTLFPHQDKVYPIPYDAFSQRAFLDSYIQEANIYLTSAGSLALPFTVDPLVMYWNRDTFDSAGIAVRPKFWDEFSELNKKLTVKDQNGNIRKSAVALGEFSNITNAREILGTLIMQTGNPITARDSEGNVVSVLKNTSMTSPAPALQFFTQSVDPSNEDYSWNRSLPESKIAFLSGMLATYFGFASELSDIRAKNANINFDTALLPRIRTGGQKVTYGRMYGFSILRSSAHIGDAYKVISTLTAPVYLSELSKTMYLPTVRRDLISQGSDDPYVSVFNQAALDSRTWLDVDPNYSRGIFRNMIESITSGKNSIDESIRDAADQYDVELRRAVQ